MSSFELNRLQSITGPVTGITPTPSADRSKAKVAPENGAPDAGGTTNAPKAAGVAVEIAAPVEAGVETGPPVDSDRVAEIRNALREGSYPLVPAKIADAMIAAQLKFEIE